MAKEVPFAAIPRRSTPEALDEFVHGTRQQQGTQLAPPQTPKKSQKPQGPMKRLTFDIPAELHMRMKLACVREGKDMTEVLRDLIATRFP
jgi:hypothetical protein